MSIFSIKKAFMPRKGSSGGETFLRYMLLILVFVGAGYLFVKHFDNTMEEIQARQSIYDQTGRLTSEQQRVFREFGRLMRDEFGVEVRVQAESGPVEMPVLNSRTLFFGIDTADKTVIIEFPPLVAAALEPEFIQYLRQDHFKPYFEQDNWPKGLAEAMRMIWDKLSEINSEGAS